MFTNIISKLTIDQKFSSANGFQITVNNLLFLLLPSLTTHRGPRRLKPSFINNMKEAISLCNDFKF